MMQAIDLILNNEQLYKRYLEDKTLQEINRSIMLVMQYGSKVIAISPGGELIDRYDDETESALKFWREKLVDHVKKNYSEFGF